MTPTDEKHLRLLSRLHYVAAALASVIPLFGAGYGTMGLSIVLGKMPSMSPTASQVLGWVPAVLGLFALLLAVATMGANLVAAHALRSRTHRTLCRLTAVVNLVHFPFGTLLGAFTLVALRRPAVRAAFEATARATRRKPGSPTGSDGEGVVFFSSPPGSVAGFPPAAPPRESP
jgi:hypothetical protein